MKYTHQQEKAISILDKNLQIIACAGSGKTQVISQRVVNIIKNGNPPAKIIAFTYTEKAAAELQARILRLCHEQIPGQTGIAEMYIGTIHAWCMNALKEYKYEFQKFSVLDEIKLKLFVDKNYSKIGMSDLNMERFKDTGHFIQLMGVVRESEFEDSAAAPQDIMEALAKYEKTLLAHCYLDFTMIMTKVVEFMDKDEGFRSKLQSHVGYLIVDEYQDVNPVQEAIIKRIYQLGANICVVGDDDQTIFQWRGSDVRYIQEFRNRYDNVEYIPLEDNFRSSKAVVDVALKCISNNTERLPKEMKAKGFQSYDRGDILYNQFTSVEEENAHIVNSINSLRGVLFQDKDGAVPRGLDYSDFAILIRKWKKAHAVIEALQEANIPFIVTGVNNLFQRLEIKAAKAIFEFLQEVIDSNVLRHYWLELSPNIDAALLDTAIEKLRKSRPNEKTYYERFNIQKIYMDFLEDSGITEDLFADGSGRSNSGYQNEEIIFYNLGMFSQIIRDFETVYFMSKPTYKLTTFLNFLRYSAEGYYPEGWLNNNYKTPNAVQIMTVYQAKGLEFPVVFIPGLNKNYLPTSQPTGKQVWHFLDRTLIKGVDRYFPHEEDERRLMYVAITRSKKFLLISRAPDGKQQGKESVFGPEVRRSEYIFSNAQRDYLERQKGEPRPSVELSNISLNFSLLKAFFDCPYSFKFWTFYGFQQPLGARIGYGSAIHNSLMELHREFLEGNHIPRGVIPELLSRHANFPYATETVVTDMTDRANQALEIYYDKNEKEFKEIEFAEKEIQIDLGEGILVNGKMDLIKKKNLDGSVEKTIIDFKSTEDAQAYHATIDQLQLYALGYKELTGENADFLQIYNLDTNDAYKNELTVSDLDNMKEKIIHAANEIRNNHLDGVCNKPDCVCRFKHKRS
ncbi:MAG: ATP-dependent helicase [Saprospiraceae bacterium]